MGDEHNAAVADRGVANRGTVGSTPSAGSAPATITIRVPMDAWSFEQAALEELKKALRVTLTSNPDELAFRDTLRAYRTDFEIRSKKRFVTLHFTPFRGYSWADVRRSPSLLYTRVHIRHELQVEDERRAEAQRLEEERRTEAKRLEEERRATADRLARSAARQRERQAAEHKIDALVPKILSETLFWIRGAVHGQYVNADFKIDYYPWQKSSQPRVAHWAENAKTIKDNLWSVYNNRSDYLLIFQVGDASAPVGDPAEAHEEPDFPLDPFMDFDDVEAEVHRYEYLRKTFAGQSQEALKAVLPSSATDLAMLAFVPFTPLLFKKLNALRKAGKLFQVMRLPLGVRQLSRVTTKTGKIDPELLKMAWRYRYGTAGSSQDAFYRNFMAAKLEVNGEIRYAGAINVKSSAYHSENELQVLRQELRREFGPKADIRVRQIFTERIPCRDCRRVLDEEFPDAQIFYVAGPGKRRAEELFTYYYDPTGL